MDPLQALINCAEALGFKDFAQAVQLLNGYYQWRVKGGFEPRAIDGKPGDEYADLLGNRIADALETPT